MTSIIATGEPANQPEPTPASLAEDLRDLADEFYIESDRFDELIERQARTLVEQDARIAALERRLTNLGNALNGSEAV